MANRVDDYFVVVLRFGHVLCTGWHVFAHSCAYHPFADLDRSTEACSVTELNALFRNEHAEQDAVSCLRLLLLVQALASLNLLVYRGVEHLGLR